MACGDAMGSSGRKGPERDQGSPSKALMVVERPGLRHEVFAAADAARKARRKVVLVIKLCTVGGSPR